MLYFACPERERALCHSVMSGKGPTSGGGGIARLSRVDRLRYTGPCSTQGPLDVGELSKTRPKGEDELA